MKYVFLLIACACLATCLIAQTHNAKLNEKSIVKDSDGMVYPYTIWRTLIMQGDYYARPIDNQNEQSEFLLVRLTEEQKKQRLEKMPKPRESDCFRTGKKFNLFKGTDINNNKINLESEKGKIIVLNFWFINCPPCRMEIPALNELVDGYKGNENLKFIAIALDSKSDIQNFLKTTPFNYAIIDRGEYLSTRFGVRGYPTHVIIDQEGKIGFHTTGLAMNTVYWLKKSIDELLSQSTVAH